MSPVLQAHGHLFRECCSARETIHRTQGRSLASPSKLELSEESSRGLRMGAGRAARGRGRKHPIQPHLLPSGTPGAQPPSWHRDMVPTWAIPGLLGPQKRKRKLSPHVGRSGGKELSYIVLLKLPVLLLGQDLVHHRHGLLPLMDVLPFLAQRRGRKGSAWGPPAAWFVASSFSRYSRHMESGLVSQAPWGRQVLWPRALPSRPQV